VRIAVMSDIHGFSLALETVLADIAVEASRAAIDEVVVAGDLCEGGPDPGGVLRRLRAGEFTVLTGNTDRDLVQAARDGWLGEGFQFVVREIGSDGLDFLAQRPFAHRITPPGRTAPDDDLLVVHANPHDLERKLLPDASDRALREVIGDTRAAAIAFGHHHVCYTRRLDDRLLVDVSAVGNPKDGDLRCKWGLLTWDDASRTWSAELRKLPYPLAETAAQIRASGVPDPEKTLRKLERASY
jgi:predicted phosphodiesterase